MRRPDCAYFTAIFTRSENRVERERVARNSGARPGHANAKPLRLNYGSFSKIVRLNKGPTGTGVSFTWLVYLHRRAVTNASNWSPNRTLASERTAACVTQMLFARSDQETRKRTGRPDMAAEDRVLLRPLCSKQ